MNEAVQHALELGLLSERVGPRNTKAEYSLTPLIHFKDRILSGRKPRADMVDSIILNGVLEPVLLWMNADLDYEIIDGNSRIVCALEVMRRFPERNHIPAMLFTGPKPSGIVTLTANNQRSYNPVGETLAIRELNESGLTVDQISQITHIPKARIYRRLNLLELPETLWKALCENKLRVSIAERIVRLGATAQATAVSLFEANGKLTHDDIAVLEQARKKEAVAGAFDGMEDLLRGSFETPATPQSGLAQATEHLKDAATLLRAEYPHYAHQLDLLLRQLHR